ncbi:MAG: GWxTD domain-containing protein [bacterium]
MAEGRWGQALDDIKKAVQGAPENMELHYQLAICEREYARLYSGGSHWTDANNEFQWILRKDSLYQDILGQYALFLYFRGEGEKAFDVAQRFVLKKPRDPRSHLTLHRLYRLFIAEHDEEEALDAFEKRGDETAQYFAGEILRRSDKLEKAEQIFRTLLSREQTMPRQPIYLSLARLYAKRDQPDSVDRCFWSAVNDIQVFAGIGFVFRDLKYIFSPTEYQHYISLSNAAQQAVFFRTFWQRRNPDPTAIHNKRLVEHYQRLNGAEEQYECWSFRQQLLPGEIPISFPPLYALNQEFNDKGLFFLRFGKPDQIATKSGWEPLSQTAGSTLRSSTELGTGTESWLYTRKENYPKMIIHFKELSGRRNEWRIGTWVSVNLLERLAAWDMSYFEVYRDPARYLDPNQSEGQQWMDKVAEEGEKTVILALSMDRSSSGEKLIQIPVHSSVTSFQGPAKRSYVDVSYAIPTTAILNKVSDTTQVVRVEIGLLVHSTSSVQFLRQVDTVSISLKAHPSGMFLDLLRFPAPPEIYNFALQVKVLGTPLVGGWSFVGKVPDYSGTDLSMSDIEILFPVPERGVLQIDGVSVMPSPFITLMTTDPVRTYVQVYNLQKDSLGKTSYTIEYKLTKVRSTENFFGKVSGLFRSKKKSGSTSKLELGGKEKDVTQYMPLVVTDIEPGDYYLTIRVTDHNRKKTIERLRPLELRE